MQGTTWSPLRLPDYRKLWLGQLVSVIGDKLHQIAMGVMVYVVTGSAVQMGLMLAMTSVPALLFGLVAGAYVDRWDRRRTMIGADLARAVLVLAVPFAAAANIYLAYAIAFCVSSIALFFQTAKQAFIADIVEPDSLLAANSLDSASTSMAELLGLGVAGALVASIGFNRAFWIDAATFLFSAGAVALIRYRRPQREQSRPPQRRNATSEVLDGLRFIRSNPTLRGLLTVWALAAVGFGAALTLAYMLALRRYDAGARGLAILDLAITAGLLVGSLTVAIPKRLKDGSKIVGGLIGFGASLAAIALAENIGIAAALLFVTGASNMWFLVPSVTLLQRLTPEELRGRVLAARFTIASVVSVVGMLLAGVLIENLNVFLTVLLAAVPPLLGALWGMLNPSVRGA